MSATTGLGVLQVAGANADARESLGTPDPWWVSGADSGGVGGVGRREARESLGTPDPWWVSGADSGELGEWGGGKQGSRWGPRTHGGALADLQGKTDSRYCVVALARSLA
ncbi:hypothetical protein FHG87_010297 [Trinorchestia longiramus]|nr:hypothetical protein FHG87_010297 [Trinorchestia longiramus]